MNKKAARTDFYREIWGSRGRFLSILFIVALGVAFFSGIRSAQPDMLKTGDTYFDKARLMDIKAVSTLGITEDDVTAIEKVEGVEKAEGAYSIDALCKGEENQKVLRVQSMPPSMNQVEVSKGRLPEKPGECLADNEMEYKVGDTIRLESGTEKAITESLTKDTLKVVGIGSSPCYISFNRGSSSIGNGSVYGFLAVPKDTFDMEVYTEAYIQAEGTVKLEAYSDAYENRVEKIKKNIKNITGNRGEIRRAGLVEDANKELDKAKKDLSDGRKEAQVKLDDAARRLADGEAKFHDGEARIADGEQQIESAKRTLNEKQQELEDAKNQYNSGKQEWEEGYAAYNQGLSQYEQQAAQYEPMIADGQAKLSEQRAKMNQGWAQYDQIKDIQDPSVQVQAQALKQQLDQGEAEYAKGQTQLDGYRQMLSDAADTLNATAAQLSDSSQELNNAWAQIADGQAKLNSGYEELKSQEAELVKAKAELYEKEPELAEGRQKYEDAKAEADAKIADGEAKIRDAQKEVSRIEHPKWYVNDRTSLPEYSGYGENADRMKAIGQVFPVLFFLVAALISLTSMTRMVEEQRTQIGTLKALGYGKFSIASKYLGYALLATLGGSIIGVLVGEKILPYIIIHSYGIMYHHMNEILTPYNAGYAWMATGAALLCTMAATAFSCYNELAAEPAVLMRPPAPKKGKRVFLERITFLWKHLSFIWKSTIRNLFRYKKRFFMTVFGIGGCMALILVGYGLKDSIFDIADIQYKEIQVYDGMAFFKEDAAKEEKEELFKFLDENKQIESYLEMDMRTFTLINGSKERDTNACVPQDPGQIEQFVNFRDRVSRETYTLLDDGAIISEKTAKLLDAKEGDTIEIKDTTYGNKKIKISNICENYMSHYIYLSPVLYEKLYGEPPEFNGMYFETETPGKKELTDVGEKILAQNAVLNVTYVHDIQKQLDDMLKTLNLVIVVLIISAGMLAFVVLYNLNNINITERKRELATIKVLGFYDSEVSAYVYRENIILTLLGAIAGSVMGAVLHRFVVVTVEVDTAMFGRSIYLPSFLYSVAFTFAFSLFVNWVMYFKLKKIDMVESLKSVE